MSNNLNLSITIPPEAFTHESAENSPTETVFEMGSDPTSYIDQSTNSPPKPKHVIINSPLQRTSYEKSGLATQSLEQAQPERSHFSQLKDFFADFSSRVSVANQYAFQVSSAVLIASLATFVPALYIHGSNWVGITIVVVLQESFGASLQQGLLRAIGTVVSGLFSILLIFIAREFPNSVKSWLAPMFLAISLFIFTYIFVYIKKKVPRAGYIGSIGPITMQVVMLAGYEDLINNKNDVVAIGFRRIACVLSGVLIGMLFSSLVFPQKASHALRENLGNIMGDITKMYSSISGVAEEFYSNGTLPTQGGIMAGVGRRLSIHRTLSVQPVQMKSPNVHVPIMSLDEARDCASEIITKLTKQLTRIDIASNEYLIQVPLHFLRNRHGRDLERARRYRSAIQHMQEMVYPFMSLTYLVPITGLTSAHINDDRDSVESATIDGIDDRVMSAYSSRTMYEFSRLMLIVMRRSSEMLLDRSSKMHKCYGQWDDMRELLECAHQEVSSELDKVLEQLRGNTDRVPELVAYYGFLTRAEACWKALTRAVTSFSSFPEMDD
ncbi:hypothetical protein K7432_013059 [Basidiobolus ranarum]|uniref:DUF2421 domain-containing protein n=1 Tax=Basidiobolus ranarum TaxID=34480 RepID=A0ABR2WJY5_9FUNG